MRLLCLFFLVPTFAWGQVTKSLTVPPDPKLSGPDLRLSMEHDALLQLSKIELGDQSSQALQELRKLSDELFSKTPFGQSEGSEQFFRRFLQRRFSLSYKHGEASQLAVTYDPASFRELLASSREPSSKVFLVDEFEIQNFTWEDLELKNPESFFSPIAAQWEKKLRASLKGKVLDVELCDRSCLKFYDDWLETQDRSKFSSDFYFLNSSFLIRRTSYDPKIRDMSFLWNGRVHASSFTSKEVSKTLEIPKETGRWMDQDQRNLNSQLATRIYRSGVVPLETAVHLILQEKAQVHSSILALKGLRNIDEARRFIDRIKRLNKSLDFQAELLALESGKILFKGSYASEEKSFTEFMSSLKDVKLTRSYKIDLDLAKGVYELNFVPN